MESSYKGRLISPPRVNSLSNDFDQLSNRIYDNNSDIHVNDGNHLSVFSSAWYKNLDENEDTANSLLSPQVYRHLSNNDGFSFCNKKNSLRPMSSIDNKSDKNFLSTFSFTGNVELSMWDMYDKKHMDCSKLIRKNSMNEMPSGIRTFSIDYNAASSLNKPKDDEYNHSFGFNNRFRFNSNPWNQDDDMIPIEQDVNAFPIINPLMDYDFSKPNSEELIVERKQNQYDDVFVSLGDDDYVPVCDQPNYDICQTNSVYENRNFNQKRMADSVPKPRSKKSKGRNDEYDFNQPYQAVINTNFDYEQAKKSEQGQIRKKNQKKPHIEVPSKKNIIDKSNEHGFDHSNNDKSQMFSRFQPNNYQFNTMNNTSPYNNFMRRPFNNNMPINMNEFVAAEAQAKAWATLCAANMNRYGSPTPIFNHQQFNPTPLNNQQFNSSPINNQHMFHPQIPSSSQPINQAPFPSKEVYSSPHLVMLAMTQGDRIKKDLVQSDKIKRDITQGDRVRRDLTQVDRIRGGVQQTNRLRLTPYTKLEVPSNNDKTPIIIEDNSCNRTILKQQSHKHSLQNPQPFEAIAEMKVACDFIGMEKKRREIVNVYSNALWGSLCVKAGGIMSAKGAMLRLSVN